MAKKTINYIESIALLVGTVVGAGVLGIPYAIKSAGFIPGTLMIIGIALLITMVNLFFGEVVLRTKRKYQLSGYAEKYLGKWAKYAISLSLFLGIYGAMIAYIIGQGDSLQALMGGSSFVWALGFWFIGTLFLYKGLEIIKVFETGMLFVILLVMCILAGLSIPHIEIQNLAYQNYDNFFAPYGVILFAFLGVTAVEQMREVLKGQEKRMYSAIIIGSLLPMVLYIAFSAVILGVTGLSTTEVGTIGLGNVIGEHMVVLGNVFAIVAMGTSFLTLGYALKQTFEYDYKLSAELSTALTAIPPLLVFLTGMVGFVEILGFVGALVGGVEGLILVLMFWAAKRKGKRKPEFHMGTRHGFTLALVIMYVCGIMVLLS